MIRKFLILLCLFFTANIAFATVPFTRLDLAQPTLSFTSDVPLQDKDWRWLRAKKTLKMGVSRPDQPPVWFTVYDRYYAGITADYSGIIGGLLGVSIEVYSYSSHELALDALKTGEIDLIGASQPLDSSRGDFMLTSSYLSNQPVIVSKISEKKRFNKDLSGLNIAVLSDYISPGKLKAKYPNSHLNYFDSVNSAFGSVAFGSDDATISDLISANYLISNTYASHLKINRLSEVSPDMDGFSYVVRKDNKNLAGIINTALKVIPAEQKEKIAERWSGSGLGLLKKGKIQFTVAEQRWIKEHPVVKINVSDYQAPVSYFDMNGVYRGLFADILNKIELNTGLHFEIIRNPQLKDMLGNLQTGDIDAFAPATRTLEREKLFSFTQALIKNQFVFISKEGSKPIVSIKQLNGKKVAIAKDTALSSYLRTKYKDIIFIDSNRDIESLGMVSSGEAVSTVMPLSIAEYYIPSLFEKELNITAVFDMDAEGMQYLPAFAVKKGNVELLSILDKALFAVSPDERAMLLSRWQPVFLAAPESWVDYQKIIYKTAGIGLIIALILFAWNAWLWRKSKQLKVAKSELSDQLFYMEGLLNSAPFSIYVIDTGGLMLSCNDFLLQRLELCRAEVVGKIYHLGMIDKAGTQELDEDYQQVLAQGVSIQKVRRWTIPTKSLIVYHWMSPYRNSLGDIKGVICGYMDITDREKLIEELKVAKELADSASKAKTTFLATMSHEIRTPMNAIIGMLELALKKADDEILDRTALEVAYNSSNNLLELIGDILDVVRIEAGGLSLSPARSNLRELIESVVRVFDGLARQKGLSLILDLDVSINRDVLIDPLRFKQILSNLLGNAIKFTDSGQIVIQVSGKQTDSEYLQVQLQLKDSGIGISYEDQQRLFEPFSQAQNQSQEVRSGTGLGLVISRELCELMGGSLVLSSALGAGTQIDIRLALIALDPLLQGQADTPLAVNASKTALHVLIVDDHKANRLLLCEQLTYLGHRVSSAENGEIGFNYWQEGRFDMVITDCNMPVMSGYELATAIRVHEAKHSFPPCRVLGFTANAQPDEVARCKAAGMDDCLFKPVSLDNLAQALVSTQLLIAEDPQVSIYSESYDIANLTRLVGNRPDAVQRLLHELIESNGQDLEELLQLFDRNDISGLGELAHKIKGAARVIQANHLILCCERLGTICKAQAGRDELSDAVYALEESIINLEQALLPHMDKIN